MTHRFAGSGPKHSQKVKHVDPWVNENGPVPGHSYRPPVPYVMEREMREALRRAKEIKALPSWHA